MEKSFDRDKKLKKFLAGIAACVTAGAACYGISEQPVSAFPVINIPYEEADINEDGCVDLSDLAALNMHIAGTANYKHGDINEDGTVNAYDMYLLHCYLTRSSIPDNKLVPGGSVTVDLGNYIVDPGSGKFRLGPKFSDPSKWEGIVCGSFEIERNDGFEISRVSADRDSNTWLYYDIYTGKVIFYCNDPSQLCDLYLTLSYSAYTEGTYKLGIKNGECFDGHGNRLPLYFTGDSVKVEDTSKPVTTEPPQVTEPTVSKPELVSEPSDISETAGNTARFKVSAAGTGLNYQWYWRKPDTSQWKACAGTGYNTDTLVVEATEARNGYQYYCEITDAAGNKLSSRKVSLNVIPAAPPVILREPDDSYTKLGSYAKFYTAADSISLSYQWYWRKPGTTQWKACAGEGYDTNTLLVEATQARDGYQYCCEVSDSAGNKVTSRTVSLNVISDAPVRPAESAAPAVEIISEPDDSYAKPGVYAKFKIRTSTENVSCQWYWRKPGSKQWKACTGTGYNTNTLWVEATEARNGYQYYCEVTDAAGNKVSSRTVNLNLSSSDPLYIYGEYSDRYVNLNSYANLYVETNHENVSYQWYWKKPGGAEWKPCTTKGYDTAYLDIQATEARNGYQYYCEITDSSGRKITSRIMELKIFGVITEKYSYTVSGGCTAEINAVTSVKAGKYQWYWRKPGTKEWTACTGTGCSTDTLEVLGEKKRDGYQYYCMVTDTYTGKKTATNIYTLNVVNPISLRDQPADITAYDDSYSIFGFSLSSGGDYTYQWYWKSPSSSEWKKCTSKGYDSRMLTVMGDMKRDGYQYYCEITDSYGFTVKTRVASLTVREYFAVDRYLRNESVYEGETAYFSVFARGKDLKYTWYCRDPRSGEWKKSTDRGCDTDTLRVRVTWDMDGYQYYCKVTDAYGNTDMTYIATVTVNYYDNIIPF